MNQKKIKVGVAAVAALTLLAGCGDSDEDSTDQVTSPETTEVATTGDAETSESSARPSGDVTTQTDNDGVWKIDVPSDWQKLGTPADQPQYIFGYGNPESTQSIIIGNLGDGRVPPAEVMVDQLKSSQPGAQISVVDNPQTIGGMEPKLAVRISTERFEGMLFYVDVDGIIYEFTANGRTEGDLDQTLAYLESASLN